MTLNQKLLETHNENFDKKFFDIDTLSKFTNKIENLLNNMIITDIDELSSQRDKSLTIQLLKKGFSKHIVSVFKRN